MAFQESNGALMEPTQPTNQRLDQKVVELLPEFSRSFAEKLIEQGRVLVNAAVVTKPSHKVSADDKVVVNYDVNEQTAPQIELPVIYQDKDCVVINKPVGALTHSKGAFNPEATVATWLAPQLTGLAGERGGIVHRLDRATSGVMICAKNPQALSWLQKQFSTRKVKKKYLAVVAGLLSPEQAVIDMPIERNPKKPQTFRTGVNGKMAITEYKVLKSNDKYSLVELKPLTGRTHQLRVHLNKIGHPIVGDSLYGGQEAARLYLHAASLEITLPNRKREVFDAPLPSEFTELI